MGCAECMRMIRNAYNTSDGKSEGKRRVGIDKATMLQTDVKERQYEGVDWIQLDQDRIC
jgi:hypothetical protein